MVHTLPKPNTAYDCLQIDNDAVININGVPTRSKKAEVLRDWILGGFSEITRCPFCSSLLLSAEYHRVSSDVEKGQYSVLCSCRNCAYWQWYVNTWNMDGILALNLWDNWISKARCFDTIPKQCNTELAQAIRRNQELWHHLEPPKLEKLVRDIYKANYNDCEVTHIGKPADGGVDVLFVDSEKRQTLIQVKQHRTSKFSEGVETVRNLLGAMVANDCLRGIVVSTADHFTYRAYETVGRNNMGMKVDLIDRGKLNLMLSPLLPRDPWKPIIKDIAPYMLKHMAHKLHNY